MDSYSHYASMDWGRLANLVRLSSTDVNAPAQSKHCPHQPQRKCLDRVGAPQSVESGGRGAEEGGPVTQRGYHPNLNERRL